MNQEVLNYRIDNRDMIVSVSRNWESFARANVWGSRLSPENVVGHLLWDFIQDSETRHLYKEVFREAGEMPRLTHGLCPNCCGAIIANLEDRGPPQKSMDSGEE